MFQYMIYERLLEFMCFLAGLTFFCVHCWYKANKYCVWDIFCAAKFITLRSDWYLFQMNTHIKTYWIEEDGGDNESRVYPCRWNKNYWPVGCTVDENSDILLNVLWRDFHFIDGESSTKDEESDEGRCERRETGNHHQINSFGIVPSYTFSYTEWSFIAFQQMVYFLFFFTSAKRHTLLLSFNKTFKKLFFSLTRPMNLSLVLFDVRLAALESSAEEIGRRSVHENYIKHVQVSFSYKSQYMNW